MFENLRTYMESLHRILSLTPKRIYPGKIVCRDGLEEKCMRIICASMLLSSRSLTLSLSLSLSLSFCLSAPTAIPAQDMVL